MTGSGPQGSGNRKRKRNLMIVAEPVPTSLSVNV